MKKKSFLKEGMIVEVELYMGGQPSKCYFTRNSLVKVINTDPYQRSDCSFIIEASNFGE